MSLGVWETDDQGEVGKGAIKKKGVDAKMIYIFPG